MICELLWFGGAVMVVGGAVCFFSFSLRFCCVSVVVAVEMDGFGWLG